MVPPLLSRLSVIDVNRRLHQLLGLGTRRKVVGEMAILRQLHHWLWRCLCDSELEGTVCIYRTRAVTPSSLCRHREPRLCLVLRRKILECRFTDIHHHANERAIEGERRLV